MWPCLISEGEGANVGNSGASINAQICGAGVGQFFRSDFLEFFVDSRILMHPSEANIFFRVLSPNWAGQYFSDAATLTAGMEPKYCLSPERWKEEVRSKTRSVLQCDLNPSPETSVHRSRLLVGWNNELFLMTPRQWWTSLTSITDILATDSSLQAFQILQPHISHSSHATTPFLRLQPSSFLGVVNICNLAWSNFPP